MITEPIADFLFRNRMDPVESYTDEQLAQMIDESNPRWAEFARELARRENERDELDPVD